MGESSIRYGGGTFDLRSAFLKLTGFLQQKHVVIIDSDPTVCAEILAASDTKGTFIEHLIATPAWDPILSTESVDGELWQSLAPKFKLIMNRIRWRDRLNEISRKHLDLLLRAMETHPERMVDSEEISRITLRILFELLFEEEIAQEDETLFYQASIEWRKEIGIKGRANPEVKRTFWSRLEQLSEKSKLWHNLKFEKEQRDHCLSAIAQPFIISPQINVSDILVASFQFLRSDPQRMEQARKWALELDRPRIGGVLLESIRLQHPFPVLEREVEKGVRIGGKVLETRTQFFLIFDRFNQDQTFNPERWLGGTVKNPYHALPFGAGPRMCMGKPIAMEMMTEMLIAFLSRFELERVQPQCKHLYSGRDNDTQSGLRESLYQLKTTSRGVWKSFRIGHNRSGSCPMQRRIR